MQTLKDQILEKYEDCKMKRDSAKLSGNKGSEKWFQKLMDYHANDYNFWSK